MAEQINDLRDREHLKLLEIFHYIWGAISCLWGLVGLAYVQLGVVMTATWTLAGNPATQNFSLVFGRLWVAMCAFSVVLFETSGILSLIAGWKYRRRKSYRFCYFVAVFNCLLVPVGTALGAFSIFVLNRESVTTLFRGQCPSGAKQ